MLKVSFSNYWKSVVTVISGTVGSQLTYFLLLPIVTRVFEPELFGHYAELLSIAAIASVAVFGGLERAYPILKDDEISSYIKLIAKVAFVALLLIFLGYSGFTKIKSDFDLLTSFLFIGLVASIAALNFLNIACLRAQLFKIQAVAKVFQSFLLCSLQLAFSLFSVSFIALALADILSRVLSFAYLGNKGAVNRSEKRVESNSVEFDLSSYKSFYGYGLFSSLLIALSTNLPVILTAWLFGAVNAATVFLAIKVASIPIALLAGSIGKVYFSEASKSRDNPSMVLELFKSNVYRLVLIFILLVLPGIYAGSILVPTLFGNEWQDASRYLLIFIPMIGAQFVVSPISLTATVFKKQYFDAIFAIVRVLLIVLPFLFSLKMGLSVEETLILMSLGSTVSYILFGYSCWCIVRKESKKNEEAYI